MITRGICLTVGLLVLLTSAGCRERCRALDRQYQAATSKQPTFDDDAYSEATRRAARDGLRSDTDVHFAGSLSLAVLNRLVGRALRTTIAAKLKAVESLDVAGVQPVDIEADPGVASVELSAASDVCGHCFRVDAALKGDVGVDVPMLGTRKTRLDGSLKFVAPIDLRPSEKEASGGRVTLGLSNLAEQSRPIVIEQLEGIPGRWSDVLSGALQNVLAQKLTEAIPDVTLANFETPGLGIEGLKWAPLGLRVDASTQRVTVGFRSNLPASAGRPLSSFNDLIELDDSTGVTVALAPELILSAVRAGFRTGSIPDRYTSDGEAAANGPVRFTLDGIDVIERSDRDAGIALGIGFRAWHLPSFGHCMWFGGRSVIRVSARDGELAVGVDRVSMETGSAGSILLQQADWKASEWMQSSSSLVSTSLSSESLSLPGFDWKASGLSLTSNDRAVAVGFGIDGTEAR